MFFDKLLLWLHIAFAIFAIGPVTVTTSFTPRYIRAGQVEVVRFLNRSTRIFGLLTLGVFLFGAIAGRQRMAQVWLTVSMTLFIVAFALLFALVERDQRTAIRKLEAAAATTASSEDAEAADAPEGTKKATKTDIDTDVRVQTARIASMSGLIALLWLIILVLMVWFA